VLPGEERMIEPHELELFGFADGAETAWDDWWRTDCEFPRPEAVRRLPPSMFET
jgi:hypothetical protein